MLPAPRSELVYGVIDRVLGGLTLREALKDTGLTPQSFGRLLEKDKAAAVAYCRAQELRADLMADEIIGIADGDNDPAKVRNQISARQWLASKLNSRRYGDRIDVNVTQTLDVTSTLAEARARLQPVRDLAGVIDVQPIDSSIKPMPELSDKQSLDAEPDIFK